MTCTFFGHRDTPNELEPTLMSTLIELIEQKNVYNFYVGNQGNFDYLARKCLIELKKIYPINYTVVLAYMPTKNKIQPMMVKSILCYPVVLKKFQENLQ